jgi:hypothetical protein
LLGLAKLSNFKGTRKGAFFVFGSLLFSVLKKGGCHRHVIVPPTPRALKTMAVRALSSFSSRCIPLRTARSLVFHEKRLHCSDILLREGQRPGTSIDRAGNWKARAS